MSTIVVFGRYSKMQQKKSYQHVAEGNVWVQRTGVHGQHIVQGQRYTVLGVLVQMTDNIDQFTNAARVESNKWMVTILE